MTALPTHDFLPPGVTDARGLLAHVARVKARVRPFIRPVQEKQQERLVQAAVERERHKAAEHARVAGIVSRYRLVLDTSADAPRLTRKSQIERIKAEVAAVWKVTVADITGSRRTQRIVYARHEFAYRLSSEFGSLSLPQIGQQIGDRDHTTALHAIRAHARRNNLPLPRGMAPDPKWSRP